MKEHRNHNLATETEQASTTSTPTTTSSTPSTSSTSSTQDRVFYKALGWMQRVLALTWILLAALIVIALYPAYMAAATPMKILIGAIYVLWITTSLPVVVISELRESLWLYLAGTATSSIVVGLSHYLVPDAGIIFFALFPLLWMSTSSLSRGTFASVAVVIGALVGISADTGFPPDIRTIATLASSGLVSVIIGFWMNWVFHTTETHWVLAQQLKEAQADLELLSHDRGVIEERERVAAEIHDTVAQGFLSIVTMARLAQRSNRQDSAETARLLDLIESAAQHNLEEARQLVSAGTPPDLDSDLVEALGRLAKRTEAESALTVQLSTRDISELAHPIASNIAVVVLRCAQEALTNAQRHSQADLVEIELCVSDEHVTLSVADNGIGFVPGQTYGIGLSMMNRRVTTTGGELDISSRPHGGTLLTAKIARTTPATAKTSPKTSTTTATRATTSTTSTTAATTAAATTGGPGLGAPEPGSSTGNVEIASNDPTGAEEL